MGQEEEPLLEEEFDLSEVMATSVSEGDGDRGDKLRVVCSAPRPVFLIPPYWLAGCGFSVLTACERLNILDLRYVVKADWGIHAAICFRS